MRTTTTNHGEVSAEATMPSRKHTRRNSPASILCTHAFGGDKWRHDLATTALPVSPMDEFRDQEDAMLWPSFREEIDDLPSSWPSEEQVVGQEALLPEEPEAEECWPSLHDRSNDLHSSILPVDSEGAAELCDRRNVHAVVPLEERSQGSGCRREAVVVARKGSHKSTHKEVNKSACNADVGFLTKTACSTSGSSQMPRLSMPAEPKATAADLSGQPVCSAMGRRRWQMLSLKWRWISRSGSHPATADTASTDLSSARPVKFVSGESLRWEDSERDSGDARPTSPSEPTILSCPQQPAPAPDDCDVHGDGGKPFFGHEDRTVREPRSYRESFRIKGGRRMTHSSEDRPPLASDHPGHEVADSSNPPTATRASERVYLALALAQPSDLLLLDRPPEVLSGPRCQQCSDLEYHLVLRGHETSDRPALYEMVPLLCKCRVAIELVEHAHGLMQTPRSSVYVSSQPLPGI